MTNAEKEKLELEKILANPRCKEKLEITKKLKELVDGLPENLRNLDVWFGDVKKVDKSIEGALAAQNAKYRVIEKSAPLETLLSRGIDPMTVFDVLQAVSLLFRRAIRRKFLENYVEVDNGNWTFANNFIGIPNQSIHDIAVDEIIDYSEKLLFKTNRLNRWLVPHLFSPVPIYARLANVFANHLGIRCLKWRLPQKTASRLLSWLIAIGQYQPLIFPEFEMKTVSGKIILVPLPI